MQTLTATSPDHVQSLRGVPYIAGHRGPEKQVMGGVWRGDRPVAETEKEKKKREMMIHCVLMYCTFPRTGGLFPRKICNNTLHSHTPPTHQSI